MKKIITGIMVLSLFAPLATYGFEIEKNPTLPIENSFIVGPAKIEAEIAEGHVKTVLLNVENRTGRTETFSISFDDFFAGNGEDQTVVIGTGENKETSLRSFLFVEKTKFVLDHGDRLLLPVTISIPAGSVPGARLGAVIVSTDRITDRITDDSRAYSATNVVGQIATLVFVNVPGDSKVEGKLEAIKTRNNSKIFWQAPVGLQILYRNDGDVYLNPYGKVDVVNMLGKQVTSYVLDPWFTLPGSLRTREIEISNGMSFGKYKAIASVNRGYDDVIDEMEVSFWIIPPVSVFLVVLFVFSIIFFISKRRKV